MNIELKTKILIVLTLIPFILPLPGNAEPNDEDDREPIVSEIQIEITDSAGNEAEWIEIAKRLIFQREGEPFSQEKYEQSIEALAVSKKFRDIHADSNTENDPFILIFRLTPFRLIKDIRIQGTYPLFEREIFTAMSIFIGDVYIPEELPKQADLIRALYRREGFDRPQIDIKGIPDPDSGHYTVEVNIQRGLINRLDVLKIDGNREFSDARLKYNFKTWTTSVIPGVSGRFIAETLKKDIENLRQFYREKGYPDAKIQYRTETDWTTHKVNVWVTIDEGQHYEVEFSGNNEFWDYTLKKDLELFKGKASSDDSIKKSVKNMLKRYHDAGYLDAKIQVEAPAETDKKEGVKKIGFNIDEGIRSIVEAVRISGNTAVDAETIDKQMLTRTPGILHDGQFVPDTLKDDISAVQSAYLKQGFMSPKIKENVAFNEPHPNEPIQNATVEIQIEEGIQTIVSHVEIKGLTVISQSEAFNFISMKAGEPYREYMIQSDENILEAIISEKGYPHVQITGISTLIDDRSEASITYIVDEGPYVEMGKVYFTGNFKTHEKVLRNELEIKPGEPFSLTRLLESQKNIRNLDIFNTVQFKTIGLKEKASQVDLFVEIEEKKPYFIEIGAGFDTEKYLYGKLKMGNHNLLGLNRNAWIGAEVSQIGYRADTGLTEPRLFGSKISATTSIYGERLIELNQDFGTSAIGISLGLTRKLTPNLLTGLNFRLERRRQFQDDSDSEIGDEYDTRTLFVTTPSLSYDTRDSFVRPKKGIFSSFSVDISKGFDNSLDDFFKYKLDGRYYFTPLDRLTFACIARIGYIDSYSSEGIVPDDQLFFLGGTSDIRGFDENMLRYDADQEPLGGKTALSGGIEARIDIGMNFELALFYDIGKIDEPITAYDESKDFRSAAGFGLRYITPIGPIGFLYGFNLAPQNEESSGRLHFSIGYTF